MTEPIIEQTWNEWKDEVRAHWGRLDEQDWQRIEADRERLLTALQERYGWTREEAQREFDAFVSSRTQLIEVEALEREAREQEAPESAEDNGVRAQPGDVLGLDTDGETTALGDTAEDEDSRRVDALRDAPKTP